MWCAGGVQVATGVAIDEFSGVIGYIGTGELCVGAGKQLDIYTEDWAGLA